MKIPFIDLQSQYQSYKEEIDTAIHTVLDSSQYIMGLSVKELESNLAKYTGAKHAIACASGTDALLIALLAIGIKPGDEIITTPFTFIASSEVISLLGAIPVFVDIEEDPYNINAFEIEDKITDRTKAIMPVHWTGRISDMHEINKIAKQNNLMVIEDSCQCMGAYYYGQHAGTFGKVGTFSGHPLKAMNAVGDAGFLITNDKEIADKVRVYRNHGLIDRDTCVEYGVNSRLDVLHAAVLLYRMEKLCGVIDKRRNNVNLYRELIEAKEVFIPTCKPHEQNAFVMFIIQAKRRDKLKEFLDGRGIQTLVYYAKALHLQPAAKQYNYKRGDFPVAEKQADEVLALPHHQYLTNDQIKFVSESINEFYQL